MLNITYRLSDSQIKLLIKKNIIEKADLNWLRPMVLILYSNSDIGARARSNPLLKAFDKMERSQNQTFFLR